MCDHFKPCVILDCTSSYLTGHGATLSCKNMINSTYPAPCVHALQVASLMQGLNKETGDFFFAIILNGIKFLI